MQLLLASSSSYRRELLSRLRIPFDWAAPDIDESALPGEAPADYVQRLACAKAQALRAQFPQHWIIGSDQACVINGTITSKPGTVAKAVAQLQQCSGKTVQFFTGLCLLAPDGQEYCLMEPFAVQFRDLSDAEIRRYVALEQPLDCAGSFKVEGLGINLFAALHGRDPNSLIGLPLIGLLELLRAAGFEPLQLAE